MARRKPPRRLPSEEFDKLLIAAGYVVPKHRAARLGAVDKEMLRAQMMAEGEDDDAPPREVRVTIAVKPAKASTRKPGGPITLNSRMLKMIAYMIDGMPGDPSRTPLDVYAAGAAVGYRRRAVRALTQSPVFRKGYVDAKAGADLSRRAPSFEQLTETVAARDRARAARSLARTPGLLIKLPTQSSPNDAGAKL